MRPKKRDPVLVWVDAHASPVMLGPVEVLLELLWKVLQALKALEILAQIVAV
jgi:hypothetical protein